MEMNENEIGRLIVNTAFNLHQKLGFLINFGEAYFKNAIIRTINGTL